MIPTNKVIISITIDKDIKEQLQKQAKELEYSMSNLVRVLIYSSLDDLGKLKNPLHIKLVKGFKAMNKTIE